MMRNNGSIPVSRQQRRRRRRRCCYKNVKSISILLFTCLSSSGVVVLADSSTTTTSMTIRGDGSSPPKILPPPQQQQQQRPRPRPRPPPPIRKDSVVVTQNPAQQQSTTTSKSKILRPPPLLPNDEDKAKITSKLDDPTTIIPPPPPNQSRNDYSVQHTNNNNNKNDSHRPLPPPPLRPTKSKTEKSSHHTINHQEQYQGNVGSSVLSKGDTMMVMRQDVESSSNQKFPPPPPPRKLPPSSTTTMQKEESINSWNLNQPPPTEIGTDTQENNNHRESSDGMIVDTEEEGDSFQSRWNNRIDDEAGSKLSSSSSSPLPPPPPRRRPPPILQRKQDNEEEEGESKRSNLLQVPGMDSTKEKKKLFNDIQYQEELSSLSQKQYYEQVNRRAARDDAFVHNDEPDNNNDQHRPNSDVMLEELSMTNEGKNRVGLAAVAVAVAADDDDELQQSQQQQEEEAESRKEEINDDTMMVLENQPINNVFPTTATTNVFENNNNNNKHVFKSHQPKLMDPNHDVVPSTTTTTPGTYHEEEEFKYQYNGPEQQRRPAYHPSKDVEEDSTSSEEKRLGLIAKVGDDMKEQKQSHTCGRLDDDSETGSTTNNLVQDDQVQDDPKISSTPSETYHQVEGSENAEVDDPLSSTTSPISTEFGDSETDRRAGAVSEKQITGPPPPRFGNEKSLPSKHPKGILPPKQPIEQLMTTVPDFEEKNLPPEMVSPQNRQIPIHQNSKKSSGATYPNNNGPRYGPCPTGQGAFPTNFQAQQQQHIRPPAQQGMNRPNYQFRNHPTAPQNRQPSRSGGTGASWKMLWNKVEKGLDGLANLEESVTGRAQQFVSSAVGGARLGNRPRSGRSVSSTPPPTSSGSVPRQNIISLKREEAKPAPTTLTPYGKKYEVAAKQEAEKDEVKTQVGGDGSRKVDWNDLMAKKMISANGGASAPDSHTHPSPPNMETRTSTQDLPRPPGQQSLQQLQQHQASITSSMPTSTIGTQQQASVSTPTETTTRPVVRPNPYGQQRQTNPPTKATDSHSRASRIPWDSSVPAKQATPRPRPKPSQLSRPISDDDDDKTSFLEKLSNSLPRIRLPSPRRLFRRRDAYQYEGMDAWNDDDENDGDKQSGLFGLFRRKPKAEAGPASLSPSIRSSDVEQVAPPLDSIMKRCDDGKSSSLLSDIDRREARLIGRYLATSDGIASMFFLLALQQVPNLGAAIPKSINDLFSTTFTKVASSLVESLETYAPFLFVSSYLTMVSANILYQPRLAELESSVATNVKSESQYAQLYLRLSTALPVDPRLPMRMRDAAVSQVVSVMSIARLRAYVTFALALLAIMTSSVIGQVFALMGDGLWQLVALSQWRSWPIEWGALGASLIGVVRSVYLSSEALIAKSLTQFLDNPLHFAFHLSIAASLLLAAFLPTLEEKRRSKPLADDEDDFALSPAAGIEQLAKLGASSASRLSLLSENFSIENALERWRLTTSAFAEGGSIFSVRQMLRSLGYSVLSAGLCSFPLVAYFVGALSVDVLAKSGLRWDSAVDVSIILLWTYNLVNSSLQKAIHSTESHRYVDDFLSALVKTLREIKESNKSKAGIQFMSSVSATAGLQVRDLWASHTSKRAWAVRGANLVCKNGEILAILGDDEAGKTRLLTTICENLIFPPKRCRTTNKVRGFVNVGGVDGSKWDQPMLKRRLGILLSDVRTMADTATLFSGWTMEELLEPVVGLQTVDPAHRLSSSERSSITLALKITGLYTSLLPKLPSKLATVVTANEEDIHPSVLRAGCSVLSPAVWSKVILTKVIAQTIFDNDNAAASMDKVENCLMGSVLILDDPTVLLSEVEEAKMLNELRKTGAATIFSTNKWATGRFADRIVVVKDGAVVESGTHNELIARGPQQSTYAAKWHAMTMQ